MGKKKTKFPQGTWVERELFLSKAFWALKGAAPQMLIYIFGKRQRGEIRDHKGNKRTDWINLNRITLPYKELENLFTDPVTKQKSGITQPRITRAIDQLLAKGFLEIKNLMQDKELDIAVSNTFTQRWEYQRYIDLANKHGFQSMVIECHGTWDNVHNVPKDVLDRMYERWEPHNAHV